MISLLPLPRACLQGTATFAHLGISPSQLPEGSSLMPYQPSLQTCPFLLLLPKHISSVTFPKSLNSSSLPFSIYLSISILLQHPSPLHRLSLPPLFLSSASTPCPISRTSLSFLSRTTHCPIQSLPYSVSPYLRFLPISCGSLLPSSSALPISTMPAYSNGPAKRRNITLHYDIRSCLSTSGVLSPVASPKKLRRLPHIFCRILELPFGSETPVQVEEKQDRYTFVIQQPGLVAEEVRAEVVEIVPGATKVVIRGAERMRAVLEELEVDLWRYRLPPSTLPEASSAVYEDGVLTVTIPKVAPSLSGELRLEDNFEDSQRGGDLPEYRDADGKSGPDDKSGAVSEVCERNPHVQGAGPRRVSGWMRSSVMKDESVSTFWCHEGSHETGMGASDGMCSSLVTVQ